MDAAILDAWRASTLEVVYCPALLAEIEGKLRPAANQRKVFDQRTGGVDYRARFAESAQLVPGLAAVEPTPPDPNDTMLFAAAIESQADYIVTGDKPLQKFNWTGQGKVISPRDFYHQVLQSDKARLRYLREAHLW